MLLLLVILSMLIGFYWGKRWAEFNKESNIDSLRKEISEQRKVISMYTHMEKEWKHQ